MERRDMLEARFGPDPKTWPAPWQDMEQGGDLGRLHAALMVGGDQTALTQAVLTRLAQPKFTVLQAILPVIVPPRVALVTFAGLWLAMAVLGYQLMGGALGNPVLALVLGEAPGWEVMQ